jgi:DNA-directed RNA polymerase specialized sigma24 family protein
MSTTSTDTTQEETEAVERFKSLTSDSVRLKAEYTQNAADRRKVITTLRSHGWSFRKIGNIVGISGQRVDSMVRLSIKLAEAQANGNGSA